MNKTIVIIAIGIVVVIGVVVILAREKPGESYEFIVAEKTTLTQEVSVTGKVVPAQRSNLGFEVSGRVNAIAVDSGSSVAYGQIIALLDNNSVEAELLSAKATLKAQEAKLNELLKGTRLEEITLAETKVSNATRTLDDARTNLKNVETKAAVDLQGLYTGAIDILNDAFIQTDDAVNKKIDALFEDDTSSNPRLSFISSNPQYQSDAQEKRLLAGTTLKNFQQEINALSSRSEDVDALLEQSITHLNQIQNLLVVLLGAVNAATGISPSTITTYKADINTARTNINTALTTINGRIQSIASQKASNQTSVSSAQKQINDAASALATAEDELVLKRAGATEEEINAQRAATEEARAQVSRTQTQLEKTVLRAPVHGIITARNIQLGEIVSPTTVAFSLTSNDPFEIEAFVAETDIANVRHDNEARITLDAYLDDIIFLGRVISIDPAETVIEGVSTYKTKLVFDAVDERIRSGMTANITIITNKKEAVIAVPQRAIYENNGKKFIRILKKQNGNESVVEQEVITGIRDGLGNIEIVSGLEKGDSIITFMKEK